MHVDHIKPRSTHPHLSLDESNLQVLCDDCNVGKSNRYEDDWRKRNPVHKKTAQDLPSLESNQANKVHIVHKVDDATRKLEVMEHEIRRLKGELQAKDKKLKTQNSTHKSKKKKKGGGGSKRFFSGVSNSMKKSATSWGYHPKSAKQLEREIAKKREQILFKKKMRAIDPKKILEVQNKLLT